jgi:hypothetical protein
MFILKFIIGVKSPAVKQAGIAGDVERAGAGFPKRRPEPQVSVAAPADSTAYDSRPAPGQVPQETLLKIVVVF